MWWYSKRKSEVASDRGSKARSLISISLCNRANVSGVLQIIKSMFFSKNTKYYVFTTWGSELHCVGQYLHDKSWPSAAGESGTMQLHKRAVYRESRTSAGTVEAEQHFHMLNSFKLFSVLRTTAASFDANKSLLCLLSKYKSTLYMLALICLSGGA